MYYVWEFSFKQTATLNQHMLIHTVVKLYTCQVCDKHFARSSNLKRHKSVYPPDKPHTSKWNVCEKGFASCLITVLQTKNHILREIMVRP